jgi:hypothetical protein
MRTAAIAAIKGYMREHIKLLEQTAKLFAEAQKHASGYERVFERTARNLAWADDLLTVVDNHALLSTMEARSRLCVSCVSSARCFQASPIEKCP